MTINQIRAAAKVARLHDRSARMCDDEAHEYAISGQYHAASAYSKEAAQSHKTAAAIRHAIRQAMEAS